MCVLSIGSWSWERMPPDSVEGLVWGFLLGLDWIEFDLETEVWTNWNRFPLNSKGSQYSGFESSFSIVFFCANKGEKSRSLLFKSQTVFTHIGIERCGLLSRHPLLVFICHSVWHHGNVGTLVIERAWNHHFLIWKVTKTNSLVKGCLMKMYVATYETSSRSIWNALLHHVYQHFVCYFSYETSVVAPQRDRM